MSIGSKAIVMKSVNIPTISLFLSGIIILPILLIIDVNLALISFVGLIFLLFLVVAPPFWLAVLLIVLIPFHSLITNLLGGYESSSRQLFAVWWEALIFIGLIRVLIRNSNRIKILKSNRWILLFAGGLVVTYIISFIRLPSIPAGFSLNLETRFIGILIFFMLIPLEQRQINLLMKLMVLSVGIIALYGIFQYFWDYERLLHLLYYAPGVYTDASQRLYSFSLNSFEPAYGAMIGILIALSFYSRYSAKWIYGPPMLILLISCLILTYTRSAYLGLIVGVATVLALDRRHLDRYFGFVSAGVVLICTILLFGGDFFPNSNFGKRLETIISRKDPSSTAHEKRMKAAINIISENPSGIGLGEYGTVQARFEGGVEKAQYAENWVLQVGVQAGLIGALAYILLTFSILFSLARKPRHNSKDNNCLRFTACGVFVAMTVAGIVIPVWDFLLPLVYTWTLIGMALRYS
ncbi:O-antigen ligase family protein [Acidobacteriota bacterium]